MRHVERLSRRSRPDRERLDCSRDGLDQPSCRVACDQLSLARILHVDADDHAFTGDEHQSDADDERVPLRPNQLDDGADGWRADPRDARESPRSWMTV